MIINSEGIILRTMKHSESNSIVTIFCKESGLITCLAKGSRSRKNKSALVSDVLSIVGITYYQKKSGELHTITRSERIVDSQKILNSQIHTNISMFILQALLQSLHKEVPHQELYEATIEIITMLNELQSNPFILFLCHQVILAKELGIELDLVNLSDIYCEYNIETSNWHKNYSDLNVNNIKFRKNDINLLNDINVIMKNGFASDRLKKYLLDEENNKISSSQKLRFLDFWTRYFSYHLEKKFKYIAY